MNEDTRTTLIDIPDEHPTMRAIDDITFEPIPQSVDGRTTGRKTLGPDKITSTDTNSVSTASIQTGAVTQAKLAASSVGQAQLKYEQVTLAFASGDTTKTATVTSGSVILGIFSSSVTSTPAYGELQLSVSSTTLTGTRSATPGGAATITYTITLIKT